MTSILPIIPISQLQRAAGKALSDVQTYAVIRNHSEDVAFVLHPRLGKALVESGMLDILLKGIDKATSDGTMEQELQRLIGNVVTELSRK